LFNIHADCVCRESGAEGAAARDERTFVADFCSRTANLFAVAEGYRIDHESTHVRASTRHGAVHEQSCVVRRNPWRSNR
jgi:hypothetical protein